MAAEAPKPISDNPSEAQARDARDNVESQLTAIRGVNSVGVGLQEDGDVRKRAIIVMGQFGEDLPTDPKEIDGVKVIFKDSPRAKSQ